MSKTTSSSIAVLDIETVGDIDPAQLKAMVGKWQAPKGWKDPDKIKAKRDKDVSDMIDRAALNPRTGRVVIAGVALRDTNNIDGGGWSYSVLVDRVKDERQLLMSLDSLLHEAATLNLVTFNGRKFDLPFLSMRAMAHGLRLLYRWPCGYHRLHTDMLDAIKKESGFDGSLDAWIIGLLGHQGKAVSGAAVAKMLEDEQYDEAADHCLECITNTAELFDRYKDVVDLYRK